MGLSHKARKKQWNMTSSGRESPNYGSKKALQSIASNHMPVYEGTNQVYAVTAGATEPAAFAGVHRNHYFDTIRRLRSRNTRRCLCLYLSKFRAMVLITSSITIGFDRCPFIPASREACTSSAKALAVIAMIGIWAASGRFCILRIALVAS